MSDWVADAPLLAACGAHETALAKASDHPARLKLRAIRKVFKRRDSTPFVAIDNLNLDVWDGEFLVLLGPSGCGKTTLLRCVAGLEQPDAGRIEMNGAAVFDGGLGVDVAPERRQIGMVFQSYALWPHMTVRENIAYPLRMRRVSRERRRELVERMLVSMNIAPLALQYPGQISGGQQQRVALARALVCGDDLILFDEPLSNVDAKLRESVRLELLALQREFGFTALYVTHDQDEAMSLASHIAVIADGRIAQLGTPQDIYLRPQTSYVARFVGSANQLPAVLRREQANAVVETALGRLSIPAENIYATGAEVVVVSRPEHWSLDGSTSPGHLAFEGEIAASAFLGPHNEYFVQMGDLKIVIWSFGRVLLQPGCHVRCSISLAHLLVLDRD